MYQLNDKQYIFKQSDGKVLNIFYNEESGICLSTMGRKNMWLEPVSIIQNALKNFSACMDGMDNIYILYQDNYGNIMLLTNKGKVWESKPVLNSKKSNINDKNLTIVNVDQTIYLFYVLEYAGNSLLSYQLIKNNKLSTPKVIDYLSSGQEPYKIVLDNQKEVYVFFKSTEAKHSLIGYKKYIASNDVWSEFIPITGQTGEYKLLSAFADKNNKLHICWNSILNSNNELVYSCKNAASEEWETEKVIAQSENTYPSASFVAIENCIILYWVKGKTIYYHMSSNNGVTWSKQNIYFFHEGKQLFCISYKSNHEDELTDTYFSEIAGNFIRGYKFAFINDNSFRVGRVEQTNVDFKISESLKTILSSVENLQGSLKVMADRIDQIDQAQQKLKTEIEKVSLKSKQLNSDLEIIDKELNTFKRPG